MSHYSVCVAIPADMIRGQAITRGNIEKMVRLILEPFYMHTEDAASLELCDITEDAKRMYETEKTVAVRYPDGHSGAISDDEFSARFVVVDGKICERVKGADSEQSVETETCKKLVYIPDTPVKGIYTFDEYCSDYCGYHRFEDGRWGTWVNPDTQWDWFQIGGRFAGKLLTRKGQKGTLLPRLKLDKAPAGFVRTDGAFKGTVDWDKLKAREREKEREQFDNLVRAYALGKDAVLDPAWEVKKGTGIYDWNDHLIYKAGETYESYRIRRGLASDSEYDLHPYAFVDKDGAWHSLGEMGCFGFSYNEKTAPAWNQEVQEFLRSLEDEDYLVILDCHI